jgi:hypothetical protein
MIHGIDRDEVLTPDWGPLRQLKELHALHPEIAEVAAGSFREKEPPQVVGSGYVAKNLEAALWASSRAHCWCYRPHVGNGPGAYRSARGRSDRESPCEGRSP